MPRKPGSHGDAESTLKIRSMVEEVMARGAYCLKTEGELALKLGVTRKTIRVHRQAIEKANAAKLTGQPIEEQRADLVARVRKVAQVALAKGNCRDASHALLTEARILGQLRDKVELTGKDGAPLHPPTIDFTTPDGRKQLVGLLVELPADVLDEAQRAKERA